jgi:hypothetical protein
MLQFLDRRISPYIQGIGGLWRFGGNLSDLGPESLTLGPLSTATYSPSIYGPGIEEVGDTAIYLDGSANSLVTNSPTGGYSGTSLRVGTGNFTLICDIKTTKTTYIPFIEYASPTTHGYILGQVGSEQLYLNLSDGSSHMYNITESICDGKWHRVICSIDRDNDKANFYIDGVASVDNPVDISACTGDITPANATNFLVGNGLLGWIDSVCVIKGQALSANLAARVNSGVLRDYSPDDEDFLKRFLPSIHHRLSTVDELLLPFTSSFLELKEEVSNLPKLIDVNNCPPGYIEAISSMFNFELIDAPFATEGERRVLASSICDIYRKRGTLATIKTIVDALGYNSGASTFTEVFPPWNPMILNRDRLFSESYNATHVYEDEFTSIDFSLWNRLNSNVNWYIVPSDLTAKVISTKSSATSNALLLPYHDNGVFVDTKMLIDATATIGDRLGFYIKYVDNTHYLKFEYYYKSADEAYWAIVRRIDSNITIMKIMDQDSPGYSPFLPYASTPLRVQVRIRGDDYCFVTMMASNGNVYSKLIQVTGIDELTGVGRGPLTLFPISSIEVKWKFFNVYELGDDYETRLISESIGDKELNITLSGVPDFNINKKSYLNKILTRYVPHGVDVSVS